MTSMNSILSLNNPFPFTTLKRDKLKTFSPTILFHEHKSSTPIDRNDEHQRQFIQRKWKQVKIMLSENSRYWLIISENSREYEKNRHVPSVQLSNSIYSYNPQDQIEGMQIKPKRRRGNLPKSTTALLKEWLSQHKKHPYPTEEEKLLLAKETDLSMQQISNWFINARRRHLPHLLENDNDSSSKSSNREFFSYEASDNSEDSDGVRRYKCPAARINKTGGIKKPYLRSNKRKSTISSIMVQ